MYPVGKYVETKTLIILVLNLLLELLMERLGFKLLLCCLVLKGDEVILPALTFVATANAISYNSAVPHFVDCEKKTWIDVNKLSEYLSFITIKWK